MTKTAIMS